MYMIIVIITSMPARADVCPFRHSGVGHGLGGNYDFYKFTTEGRFYKGLGNGHILALRVMAGYIDGNVPYGNLFDLGGSNTLRGYEDDSLREVKCMPLLWNTVSPSQRRYRGSYLPIWVRLGGLMKERFRGIRMATLLISSVGVGLRLQTPIGPIRLDYGHGDRNKFHFSFGTQF